MNQTTSFSASHFLHKYLEFKAMAPDQTKWTAANLKKNPPRYYRFLELEALLQAFDIGEDLIKDFTQLGFVERRNPQELTQLNEAVATYASKRDSDEQQFTQQGNQVKSYQLRMLVHQLLGFFETMRQALHFNSGVMEAGSVSFRFIIQQTQSVLEDIDLSKLKRIESLLCCIIDPKSRSFSRQELIDQYGFPDVNLRDIDMEWM